MTYAVCTICGDTFPHTLSFFTLRKNRPSRQCRLCESARLKAKIRQPPSKADAERSRRWREANPDKVRATYNAWRARNPDRIRDSQRRAHARLRRENIEYRLSRLVSRSLRYCLSGRQKTAKWFAILGYTAADLKRHLERQFSREMTWANHGTYWHIDHIVPISSFDFTTDSGLKACWALPNLRPLEATANIKKKNKRTHLL